MSDARFKENEPDELQDAIEAVTKTLEAMQKYASRRKGNVSRLGLCRAIVKALQDVDFGDTTYEGREHPYSIVWHILTECNVGHPSDEQRPPWLSTDLIERRRTLEEYLKYEIMDGKIDFRVRASEVNGHISFYIHADGKDSETTDYLVVGNGLSTKVDTIREGVERG